MTSPPGVDDHLGALTDDERAALAAWADDGDVPDGFEDRVVAAFASTWGAGASTTGPGERAGSPDPLGGMGRLDPGRLLEGDALATGPRAAVREGRVLRLVGLCAAVAAAAAVMLMVRVLPRASEVEPAREVASVERAEPAEPIVRIEPPAAVPAPAGECDTDVLAAEATLVAAQHCSPCHDSAARDAVPGAVDVFDIQQQEWWSLMSETQIEGARRRARVIEDATEEDRAKLDAFLARRLEPPPYAG